MLSPCDPGPAVVACNTCRHSPDANGDANGGAGGGADGRSDGARLAAALHRVKASDQGYDGVAVQEMPCLFACRDACAVHLRGAGKIGYVLGRFRPDEDAARAILDYARAYARSDTGEVPFDDWPEGVKGRFLTRTPPAGFIID